MQAQFMVQKFVFILALLSTAIAADTTYYVDPDYSGGTKNGAVSTPWSALDAGAWSAINTALASGNVTVYFSALETDGTTQESQTVCIETFRSDTSSNRLTLDGGSKYNTNDSSPSWSDNPTSIASSYLNNKVFEIVDGVGQMAIGHNVPSATNKKQDNLTVRGFELRGTAPRMKFAGDNLIVEYIWAHDITAQDPTMFLTQYTFPTGATDIGDRLIDNCTNIVAQNMRIENQRGEAIYLGATLDTLDDALEDAIGNSHSDITISNVTFSAIGLNGGQGDGVDGKRGIVGLHVVDCTFDGCNGIAGVVMAGTYTDVDSQYLIERCTIKNNGSSDEGLAVSGVLATPPTRYLVGPTIRNCVILGNKAGIKISRGVGNPKLSDIRVQNCTIGDQPTTFLFANIHSNLFLQNNLLIRHAGISLSSVTNVTMDYNLYSPSWTSSYHGANDAVLSTTNVFLEYPTNLRLLPSSEPIDYGDDLSALFTDDILQTSRPQFTAWDVGAYEYSTTIPSGNSINVGTLTVGTIQ